MNTQCGVSRGNILRNAKLMSMLVILSTFGGCADVKEKVAQVREMIRKMRGLEPAPPAPLPPTMQAGIPAPAASARAPSLRADCSAKDETGYVESIKLALESGQVGQLEAKVEIPRRGSCQFRLADFRQTRTAPHVELKSNSGSMCTVRMWEQGDHFTVAFSDCQDRCTRGAFDYVWPIELSATDGSCL